MAQFSRRTILAATDLLPALTHAEIDRFALEHGLERIFVGNSKVDRVNTLARYLIDHPEELNEDGGNLTDGIVTLLTEGAIGRSVGGYPSYMFDLNIFQERFPALNRALERDGFTVEDGLLRRTLPQNLDLPKADDEVHVLLDRHHLVVPKRHLDQGIAAHVRGDWAAANAQFRTFVESLLDEIAGKAPAPPGGYPATGHPRRQFLAQTTPPFFIARLNEWSNDGKGFYEGFFRRLHPEGSHPGLSDEEDSTFRFHLVLLVGRHLLRRLDTLTRG
jgi:hypothetical protein